MKSLPSGRQLASLLVPFVVLVVIPAAILRLNPPPAGGWSESAVTGAALSILAAGVIVLGLGLLAATSLLFFRHGQGTIMPWDATRRLVVRGIYRHVRNPMHIGVFLALVGEGLLARAPSILVFGAAFLVVHFAYIPLVEERGLEARFGEAYRRYKRNVPRWIPRLKPWDPEMP